MVHGLDLGLMFYVADVDAQFAKALAAGGVVKQPLKDQFYGDRSGTITDPLTPGTPRWMCEAVDPATRPE